MLSDDIRDLFNIKYPIVQAGMIWCSGWELASAVSNSGGLGLIGAGSMYPDVLRTHIRKCKNATHLPFGINVPLLYPEVDKLIDIIVQEKVKIVFTSAGNPAVWTKNLQSKGVIVAHVVSSLKFAIKAEKEGVNAIVAEGFEAGGHNGREETTTFCLVPLVSRKVKIPVIAAGGIANGRSMLSAFSLGAKGVQIGSRFVATKESSAHPNFKQAILNCNEDSTILMLKKLTPVRLVKNKLAKRLIESEQRGDTIDKLSSMLGTARAKKGMFEGDIEEGELEIGQCASQIQFIKPASTVIEELWEEFKEAKTQLDSIKIC